MTPTYADMDTLRAALVAGQCETALQILDSIAAAEEPEPLASDRQCYYLASITGLQYQTIKGWELTNAQAKPGIAELLANEQADIGGHHLTMSQTFRDKQTKKSAIPW